MSDNHKGLFGNMSHLQTARDQINMMKQQGIMPMNPSDGTITPIRLDDFAPSFELLEGAIDLFLEGLITKKEFLKLKIMIKSKDSELRDMVENILLEKTKEDVV